jgi:hypothetical protein
MKDNVIRDVRGTGTEKLDCETWSTVKEYLSDY